MASSRKAKDEVRGGLISRAAKCAIPFALSVVFFSVPSRAAPTAEDRALATELFNQGRDLMAAGKNEEACPKLAESHRLDPGGGTVLNLALCYEATGKLASAYSALNEALALARRDDREDRVKIATEHLASVEPRLSRLVVEVPPDSDLANLEIRRDGSEVVRAAWGSAMPVDGGKHRIQVSAPGYVAWSTTVDVLAESDKKVVPVPKLVLEAKPAPALPPVVVAPAPRKPAPARAPAREKASSGETQRILGFVAGGVGVVGIGAGTYFGLRAFSKRDASEAECKGGCTVRGAELSSEATKAADWSTASFALGLATLGVGTYLVWSAPEAGSAPKVGVMVGTGGMAVRGRF